MTSSQHRSGPRPLPKERAVDPSVLYRAAKLYYEQDATQAEIAQRLSTSRATVSRLLSEARRQGIVRIEVRPPEPHDLAALERELAKALGLQRVYLGTLIKPPQDGNGELLVGEALSPAVGRALVDVGLAPGDVLLVSSGRAVYDVATRDLPRLPGVVVAPTVGGTDQPEGWYQTNEATRRLADRIGGRATYLFAPALPGPELFETLRNDPAIQRVTHLWPHARCVLTGIGAPPLLRQYIPDFIPSNLSSLIPAAGDISSRFYDRDGKPLAFPGSERLMGIELELLHTIPAVIAVAAGEEKTSSLSAAARAGYFNRLVTDAATAKRLLAAL